MGLFVQVVKLVTMVTDARRVVLISVLVVETTHSAMIVLMDTLDRTATTDVPMRVPRVQVMTRVPPVDQAELVHVVTTKSWLILWL